MTLSIDEADLPAGLSFDPLTGILSGTLDPSASQGAPNGVFEIPVTATDESGETFTTILTYTVTNPAPVVDTPIGPMAALDGDVVSIASDISDPDGDVLTYSATGLPAGLSIDLVTGEITGATDNSASQGGPNADGIYTITVTADDGEGGTVTDTFEYTVTNPAPTAVDDALSASEDMAVTGNVITANDSDPDGDVLNVTEVAGNPANVGPPISGSTGGIFTINADGEVTFDPNGEFEDLALGETATSTIAYMISDGEGGTDTAIVTVTIEGTNDAPVVTGPLVEQNLSDARSAEPLDASTAFADVDGESMTFEAIGLPAGLSIDPATGLVTGTVSADASQGGENSDGVYIVEILATDPSGETASIFVTYTIENPVPVAENDVFSTPEDTPVSVNIIDNDSDLDGDILVIDAAALPDGTILAVGTPINLPEGELTINADGTIDFIPASDLSGKLVFGYTVSDNEGGTDIGTVTLNVEPMNDAPVATPELLGGPDLMGGNVGFSTSDAPSLTSEDGTEVSIPTATIFVDPDGDILTYSVTGLPDGLTIDPETGLITGTIANSASSSGPYDVTVTAVDTEGASVEMMFTFNVTNPAPVIGDVELPITPPVVGEAVIIDVGAVTQDPDGDVLTFSAVDLPPGLSIDPATGLITGTVTIPQTEPFVFTVSVTDGEGGTDQVELTLQVNEDGFIIPNDTADLGPDLGILNTADPYEFLEDQPIDLQRYFHERALDARDEYGRMFGDRDFRGGMVAVHLPGMGDECAYMVVEAVADDHNVTVSLGSSISAVCDVNVSSWDVTMADGTPLPAWINWSNGSNFIDISRPANGEMLGLKIRALLDNGRVGSIAVDIDLHNGAVTQTGDAYAQGQTLQQQLALETLDMKERTTEADRAQEALLQALSA